MEVILKHFVKNDLAYLISHFKLYLGLGNSRNPIFDFAFVPLCPFFKPRGGKLNIFEDFRKFCSGTSETNSEIRVFLKRNTKLNLAVSKRNTGQGQDTGTVLYTPTDSGRLLFV